MTAKDVYDKSPKTTEEEQVEAFANAINACKNLSDFLEIADIIGKEANSETSPLSTQCFVEVEAFFDEKIVSVMPVEYEEIKRVEDARAYFSLMPYESIWKLALLRRVIMLAKNYSDLQEVYEESVEESNYLFLKLINANMSHLAAK